MTVFHLISAAASKHTFRNTGVVSKSVPPSIFVFPYLSINLTLAVSQKVTWAYVDKNLNFKVIERTITAVGNVSKCLTVEIYMEKKKNLIVSCR